MGVFALCLLVGTLKRGIQANAMAQSRTYTYTDTYTDTDTDTDTDTHTDIQPRIQTTDHGTSMCTHCVAGRDFGDVEFGQRRDCRF